MHTPTAIKLSPAKSGCGGMSSEEEPLEHEDIIKRQIRTGFREYERSDLGVFLSAFTAGLEIGFSILFMGVLYQMWHESTTENILHLITAIGYPLGFIFVIIGRSELFTEQTALAMLPVFNGNATVKELFSLWGFVIAGNLVGGLLFSFFITWIGPEMKMISADTFVHLAKKVIHPRWDIILGSAVLAGWMMGLLGWLITSSKESISHIVIVILITVIIGIGGLHHSIVGSVEVLCGLMVSDAITIYDYLRFLAFAVLGNIIGGAFFVSTLKYSQLKVQDVWPRKSHR